MSLNFKEEEFRVLVLLAACQGEENINEQLQSILKQIDVAVKVIVSVDPSLDATADLVKFYAEQDARLQILPLTSASGGAGQNFFRLLRDVEFSDFDFVAFSDQDDIWYPDKLWRAVKQLQKSNADCYSSNVLAFWEDGSKKLIDKAQMQREWDFLFESAGPGCTYVLKRGVAEEFRKLLFSRPEDASQIALHDWSLYAFSRSRGYRWIIDSRPSMDYRQHSSNQYGANTGWRAFNVRAKKIIEGWGVNQARLIARFVGLENEPFCKPWQRKGRLGMLWLALNSYRARRRISDRFVFAFACLLLALVGDRSDE